MIAANDEMQAFVAALASMAPAQLLQGIATAAGLHAHAEGSKTTEVALVRIAWAIPFGEAAA